MEFPRFFPKHLERNESLYIPLIRNFLAIHGKSNSFLLCAHKITFCNFGQFKISPNSFFNNSSSLSPAKLLMRILLFLHKFQIEMQIISQFCQAFSISIKSARNIFSSLFVLVFYPKVFVLVSDNLEKSSTCGTVSISRKKPFLSEYFTRSFWLVLVFWVCI